MNKRCQWAEGDDLLRQYHDNEWGKPIRDSRALWELLMLEGFQAGLSWLIVLRKRQALRAAFKGFDPNRVAAFTSDDVERLLLDSGIIRSRAKIQATIGGAQAYLRMQQNGEDFANLAWHWVGGQPIRNSGVLPPVKTELSETISKALKKRGFKFVGPVIVYSWMQAAGLVDDHAADCFVQPRVAQAGGLKRGAKQAGPRQAGPAQS